MLVIGKLYKIILFHRLGQTNGR